MAALSFFGGTEYYIEWHEGRGALAVVIGGVLLATIAELRRPALSRKKAMLKEAVSRYEKMLIEPLP